MMSDLIVIGAGPGGYETAVRAAERGLSVLIVEAAGLGGTCLNAGCIPTKCLCRTAEVVEEVRRAGEFGVNVAGFSLDLTRAMERKASVVATLRKGVETLLAHPNIALCRGKACFASPHTIEVDGVCHEAPHIIIATGSLPRSLPVLGADLPGVVSSTELLQTPAVPPRLAIVGGGVVGLEFASIFAAFGSKVDVVEYCKEILPGLDRDLAKRLRLELKKRGIAFHTEAAVQAITPVAPPEGGLAVVFTEKGKEAHVEADTVLIAVGRQPNYAGLGLERAGVVTGPRGIVVDSFMQTTVQGVYAIGDVNGLCPLAHAAMAQGICALNHILGEAPAIDLSLIPSAVFTMPEVASVGLTEEACKAAGIDYTADKAFYRANGKALAEGAPEGYVKLLKEGENGEGRLIGAHILGLHAADLIHEAAAFIARKGEQGTAARLLATIHAHPTLSELFPSALKHSSK